MSLRGRARTLCTGLFLALTGTCWGAALEVTPVMHELQASQQALSMQVVNRGSAVATLQVRAFDWEQEDGKERLTPMNNVILSPAIFTVEAGRMQIVRVLFPEGASARERSHRILIDELPDLDSPEPVRFALRLSVPVFRLPLVSPSPATLKWRLDAGSKKLVAVNEGGRRERIRELLLTPDQGEPVKPTTPWGHYLLAGKERSWSVDALSRPMKPGERWTLVAQTDAGRIEVPLVVAP